MNDYWFYLKKQVYVEFKPKQVLLYDTDNGGMLLVTDGKMRVLLEEVCNPDNLGSIPVDEALCQEAGIREGLQEIADRQMGGLLKQEEGRGKPIALRPLLNLNKDFEKLADKPDADIYLKRDIGKYLLNLHICLNSEDGQTKELDKATLEAVLAQVAYLPLQTIHFLGGDIYRYSHLDLLKRMSHRQEWHFHTHYANYCPDDFINSQCLEMTVTFPCDDSRLQYVWQEVKSRRVKVHFILASLQEWEQAMRYVDELSIGDYELHPFYTGQNLGFFEEYVFIDLEDLQARPLSIHEIFRNQKMNANFFGNLYVEPTGEVKASRNTTPLGHIGEQSLLDLIYQELRENTAWRRVRNSTPCKDCIYQYLSPPLSEYEQALGRDNLCHIR